MRCIFCKSDSSSSRSVEHIVPESLGNECYVLPIGVVCDSCNNYLSREVEKPFLDAPYLRERRFRMAVPSKRGRVPPLEGIHLQSLMPMSLIREPYKGLDHEWSSPSIGSTSELNEGRLISSIENEVTQSMIFPVGNIPSNSIVARFIGKIGLEAMADRALGVSGGIDEIIDHEALDELRNFVRRRSSGKYWPISHRQLYDAELGFLDEGLQYQVLHEFDILVTNDSEYFIAVAIFGEEYVLNLGGPCIDGYEKWLKDNSF